MVASLSAAFEMAKHGKPRRGPAYNKTESSPKISPVSGQNLVGPGFPDMGTVQPSHMGSQSAVPSKMDNYMDSNMDVPPIDRGAYGPGY